jgi:hypothetical protein
MARRSVHMHNAGAIRRTNSVETAEFSARERWHTSCIKEFERLAAGQD